MLKILLIRFSSIGDIVLTTPVVRCLKKQQTAVEIHYLTKASFKILITNNPYIDKVHLFKNDLKTLIQQLKAEQFDYVIDLHHNLRTLRIKQALGVKSNSFDKINVAKWLMVNMKWNRLPKVHIVDRYLDTLQALPFSIQNDGAGLDYFIPEKDKVNIVTHFPAIGERPYVAMTVGAAHHTKCLPIRQQMNLCEIIEYPVILLGSSVDADAGDLIAKKSGKHVFNACGLFNLNQSASLVQQAHKVISHDTGLMHIAAAFNRPIVSIWGNTIPEFGMSPYLPKRNPAPQKVIEVKNLPCRPCSKIGYAKCPKKHFACMDLIDESEIADWINEG